MTDNAKAKMLYYGPSSLSNAELLSLVIQTGAAGKTAEEVAQDTLSYVHDNIGDLGSAEVRELSEVYGIGDAKAATIVAAMELGKRIQTERALKKLTKVCGSSEVADLLISQYSDQEREHLVTLCLNSKLQVISQHIVSIGSIDSAPVHPREVFSPAVKRGAAAIIVAHNHPSGDPTPSPEDIRVTKRLEEAGEILGIKLMDHLILGGRRYKSMREDGIIS